MKKEVVAIIIISLLLIGSVVYLFMLYNKNKELELNNSQLNTDKNKAVSDMEQCRVDLEEKKSELTMLNQDVSNIYKGCITDNVCKGHFPNIRWYCNNVGDETKENPSHICVCDSSCSLNITEIKQ